MPSFQTFINRLKRSKNDYREYVEDILDDYIINDDRKLSIYKINAENWFYNVKSMHAISKEFGAKYYVFLQPTMGIIPTHIPIDKNSNDYKIYNEYNYFDKELNQDYFEMINNLYRELRLYCEKLDYCIDISNELKPTGELYEDIRHLNAKGNYELAEIIKKNILNNN